MDEPESSRCRGRGRGVWRKPPSDSAQQQRRQDVLKAEDSSVPGNNSKRLQNAIPFHDNILGGALKGCAAEDKSRVEEIEERPGVFSQISVIQAPVIPDKVQTSASAENAESVSGYVPKSIVEAAHEFRMDAVLSPEPISKYFFCRVCGSPAGKDHFACISRGHPICRLCKEELNLIACPCPFVYEDELQICESGLHEFRSIFREFMFDNTEVGCIYREEGCEIEGLWEHVKDHQQGCGYRPLRTDLD